MLKGEAGRYQFKDLEPFAIGREGILRIFDITVVVFS